jgi:thiol-disulfide isomerase/thioredoxin
MIREAIVSLIAVVAFIGIYYAVTGTPPGARIVEEEPPAPNGLDPQQATFRFFYATWCPHCKNAEQPWHSFKQMVKNSGYKYGNKYVMFEEINAEIDKGKTALYNVKAYPTFKVETNKKIYTMLGKPSVENFRTFLKKTLGSEESTHS